MLQDQQTGLRLIELLLIITFAAVSFLDVRKTKTSARHLSKETLHLIICLFKNITVSSNIVFVIVQCT